MSRQLAELESLLAQQIAEHRRLLKQFEAHQAAMKSLDLKAMEEAAKQQEGCRLRIGSIEMRRRAVVQQLGLMLKLDANPTLTAIANAMPAHRQRLMDLRAELTGLIQQVSARVTVAGRLAGALLGHLNTAVRLIAGAVEQAGLYNKDGNPQVSGRIGVMEAVA